LLSPMPSSSVSSALLDRIWVLKTTLRQQQGAELRQTGTMTPRFLPSARTLPHPTIGPVLPFHPDAHRLTTRFWPLRSDALAFITSSAHLYRQKLLSALGIPE